MRAYIIMNEENIPALTETLPKMQGWLSFSLIEPLERKKKRNGDIILYQDLPMKCEYCNLTDDTVVYHHYYGRRYHHLQDHIANRIPLCHMHHNGSSEFSAHLTPKDFNEWIRFKRGEKWYSELKEAQFLTQ